MGGSESRFVAHPIRQNKYLTLEDPHASEQRIVLGDRDDKKGYHTFFFRKDDKSKYALNIRFDKDSDLYICATPPGAECKSDKWDAVTSIKRPDNPAEGQWKIFVVGKRKTGTLEWKQEDDYKLNWDHMKGHSIKAVLLNMASKMVLSTGPSGKLCVEKLKLSPNKELVKPVPAVFWDIETVDHSLSPGEKTAAIVGGISGGAAIVGITVLTVATAGIGLAVLGGGAAVAGGGAAVGGAAAASGSFIAGSFAAGGAGAAAAGGGAALAGGAAATGGVLAIGGTIGAIGAAIVNEGIKAMKKAAVIGIGAVKDGLEAIRDDDEGIPDPENSEEKQLQYIAIMIEEFEADQ